MSDRPPRGAVRVSKPIEVTYSANCPPIEARIEDISETGFYMDTTHPLTVDATIKFKFFLPDESPKEPIKGSARVVWTESMVGVGVEYLDISDEDRDRVRFFVASIFFGHAE